MGHVPMRGSLLAVASLTLLLLANATSDAQAMQLELREEITRLRTENARLHESNLNQNKLKAKLPNLLPNIPNADRTSESSPGENAPGSYAPHSRLGEKMLRKSKKTAVDLSKAELDARPSSDWLYRSGDDICIRISGEST